MMFGRHSLTALAASALALTLTACGTAPALVSSGRLAPASQSQVAAVPPQSAFTTIKVTVVKLLPDDTVGLPHQNFVVKEISPEAGLVLTVNHDTKYGKKVKGLEVGQTLTIRGVEYHGKSEGIHWTHKANVPGDAGYILTADGTKYE